MSLSVYRARARRCVPQLACATLVSLAALVASSTAHAQQHGGGMPGHGIMQPPPPGVMGAHMPPAGKTMLMYSSRWMKAEGLRIGTREVSPETVVLTVPNVNAPPAQIRMVPLHMNMHMQMLGITHGLTPWLSVSLAASYARKDVQMLTFQGMMGTTRLGTSTIGTEGLGDSRVGVNIRLWEQHGQMLHAGLGVMLPTGSITETVRPLMPNGMRNTTRAMYGMQLGTGTFDFSPTLTYLSNWGAFNFGLAYQGRIALEDENDEGYRWGDKHTLTAWLSYALTRNLSATGRIEASTQAAISGRDALIAGAGRGANPAFYGGERIELFAGFNARTHLTGFGMARLGFEVGKPVYENTNGPQLSRDWSLQFTASTRF